jgi:aminoglycoside 2'-N-acetyltransferase I
MPDTRLEVAHTSALPTNVLAAVRALMEDAFEERWHDTDWDHTIGGMHALVWEGDELISHASVVQRRLLHGGRSLRAGYVEGVATRADRRMRGHAAATMDVIEQIIRDAYDLGALSASAGAVGLYIARGWEQWQGPTSAFTPHGIERTEDDDDSTYVLRGNARLDLRAALTCDWRDGDVW